MITCDELEGWGKEAVLNYPKVLYWHSCGRSRKIPVSIAGVLAEAHTIYLLNSNQVC
jgi:hypothetical protein